MLRTRRDFAGEWLAASLILLAPASANAQTDQAAAASAKIFTPADFARFAPRTAYDMLTQVPGFTIRSADDTRGLGEASENVLINGQRVTDKSGGGATAQLEKVPAGDVERIEIKEAASLGIAGLTGQVANVILKADRKASGTYSWSPQLRPHFAKPRWLAGSVNYSGTSGALGYTLSLVNNPGRGAMGGNDYRILSPDGVVIEKRDQVYWNSFDQARLSAILKYGGEGPVRANLNLAFEPYWNRGDNFQRRVRIDGNDNDWDNRRRTHGFQYDVGGDVSVPLGGGRLKLIGLRHYEHAPATYDQRTDFDSGAPSVGTRYGQDSKIGETIGRLEYRWKGGRNDWTLSIERADNRLAQISTLASLQSDGSYADIPFPQGSGTVVEKRYEAVAALSRPLSSKLDLQLAGGAEYSELADLGSTEPARRFFRPKGSAAFAWRPATGWDASLKFERKVGQISFYDFLANQDITNDRENDANPNLVPPQSWELTGELGRNLGRWGKTRLKLYRHWVEDIVDHIPVGIDGDAVGNLPNATRWGMESISMIQFEPIGWKGAKLDADIGFERSRVRDPLTGEERVISNTRDRWAEVTLRHDIPGTQVAWGLGISLQHYGLAYYLDEINQSWEGPYTSAFIELKDVKGLKVNFQVFNLNDGHVRNYRTVYSGRRSTAPVSFYERQHQMVGPIFTLTVQGTF
ncbi:TonB-dependent receptor plug domain-containing protein [Sphingomonas sp. 7/4-4]|uniref:TonB-dependent receptor plug domain-containing protein n=1 Tax=Sphingomonas sp. 7/4-4 TaxID=3018446 RepID=UPI0022F3CDD4|nr:TonB-dependent receptor plug domain-containing protein [Sphingomonas sp. 7/4-4]WBY09310.1 TonB-dependent receptor plug domain-containing protein [Sphingomonas sp. 7/4-4]